MLCSAPHAPVASGIGRGASPSNELVDGCATYLLQEQRTQAETYETLSLICSFKRRRHGQAASTHVPPGLAQRARPPGTPVNG